MKKRTQKKPVRKVTRPIPQAKPVSPSNSFQLILWLVVIFASIIIILSKI